MRDGTPETEVSELASLAGLPVPALPFAQRIKTLAEASPHAKLQGVNASSAYERTPLRETRYQRAVQLWEDRVGSPQASGPVRR